jgi:hypothetical protein
MDILHNITKDDEESYKINMDELYEKKQQRDLNTLNTYNKILTRIHNKIKYTSKQTITEKFCWYVIPEVVLGVPKFDHTSCTAYIIHKLRENGFIVKYTHPNLLFISWNHWVPSYVRNEIKKKTGIQVDSFGNELNEDDSNQNINTDNNFDNIVLSKKLNFNLDSTSEVKDNKKSNDKFKKIDSYKPSGNLIYSNELFKKMQI